MSAKASSIRFGVSALVGTNKAGVLRQDEQGYINGLVLGALNSFNARGEYYVGDDAEVMGLFKEGSDFLIRLKDGRVSGENGHPEPLPGECEEAFVCRFNRVNESRVCCFHAEIALAEQSVKTADGNNVIPVYGKTAPSGELIYVMTEALRRPEENICFSLRGATFDRVQHGIKYRHLRQIVTYDKVNDPGLSAAKKWNAISLESASMSQALVSRQDDPGFTGCKDLEYSDICRAIEYSKRVGLAVESTNQLMTFGELLANVGFAHNPDMNSARGWRGWVNDAVRDARRG